MSIPGRRRAASCWLLPAMIGSALIGSTAGCAADPGHEVTRAATTITDPAPSTSPEASEPSAGSDPPAGEGPPVVDRSVRIADLKEASGLAPSLRRRGVLWSHNDSGDDARLFAVGTDGRPAGVVGLRGVTSRDAEAIQTLEVPGAGPVVVLGDIGDNAAVRDGKGARLPQLIVLPEPVARKGKVDPSLRISFSYPDGPHDAETLLADPRDQRLYVLTKSMLSATLFAVPAKVWPGKDGAAARRAAKGGGPVTVSTRLKRVAELPMVLATDGTVAADGALIVRGYGSLSVFPPVEDLPQDDVARATGATRLPPQPQGESLSLDPRHPGSVLVGSEGSRRPIYRVPLP